MAMTIEDEHLESSFLTDNFVFQWQPVVATNFSICRFHLLLEIMTSN